MTVDVLEEIRRRPGMYTGGTDKYGLHHLLFWALDDIAANVRAGRGTNLIVRLYDDGDCEICDDGPPVALGQPPTPETIDALTRSMGPKLTRGEIHVEHCRSYLVVLRALCRDLTIYAKSRTRQVGLHYRRMLATGHHALPSTTSKDQGTSFTTRFRPDPEIFGDAAFDLEMVRVRLLQVAATAGVRCELRCGATDTAEDLTCPNGMADLLRSRILGNDANYLFPRVPFRVTVSEPHRSLDVALLWPESESECKHLPVDPEERIASWANTVRTREGTHVAGLLDALHSARALCPYPVGVISVFLAAPRLVSPVKDRLVNIEIRRFVSEHVGAALRRFVEQDMEFSMDILRPDPIVAPADPLGSGHSQTSEGSVETEEHDCDHCGAKVTAPTVLNCQSCGRDGCSECMPAGRGVPCPECEEEEEDDDDDDDEDDDDDDDESEGS